MWKVSVKFLTIFRYVRCSLYTKTGCKASAVQNCKTMQLKVFKTHNHAPVLNENSVVTFLNALKSAIDLERTLKDIYDEIAPRYFQVIVVYSYDGISREDFQRYNHK